jgi:thiol-disulfide isomerase/thioredoxin
LAGPDLLDPDRTLSLQDFAGQVVVINIWGQWCGPCRSEMPQLEQVYENTRDRGVAFLGIDVRDNNRTAAVDFVTDRNIGFPSIYDPSMRTMIAFGASTRPRSSVHPGARPAAPVAAVYPAELLADDLQPVSSGWLRRIERADHRWPAADGSGPEPVGRAGVLRLAVRVCRWYPAISPTWRPFPAVPADGGGRRGALFVAGFTVVFLLGSVAVLGMTTTLITNQELLKRIGGW